MTRKLPTLLFALLASIAVTITTANANSLDKAQIEAMGERLNLTEAQRVSTTPIISEGVTERMAILKDAGIERGKKPTLSQWLKVREPMRKSQAETERRLSEVLNPQQMTEYRQIVKEFREKIRSQYE